MGSTLASDDEASMLTPRDDEDAVVAATVEVRFRKRSSQEQTQLFRGTRSIRSRVGHVQKGKRNAKQ